MPKPKQTPSLRLLSAQRFLRVALSTLKLGFLLAVLVAPYIYTRAGTPTRVEAATSSTLNFQARLYSATGTLVPDGNYHIEFKLHDNISSSGGAQGTCSGSCVWRETRTTGNLVTVRNGYFSVNLGSVTSFPTINWDQDLYLSMNIGGTSGPSWDGEMTPRIKLTAVPYAFRSGGITSYNGTQSGNLTFGAVTNSPNIILPNISGTNNVLLQSGTTLFTQGSIPFTDANGRLAQDNANFFFDDINNTLGIGIARSGAINGSGNARLIIRGSGTSSSTSSLNVTNSSNSSLFFVRDDGNVGIGTATPNSLLHVSRNVAGNLISAEFSNNQGSAGDSVSIKLIAGNSTAGEFGTILMHERQGTSGGDFLIKTSPTLSGTPLERLRITKDGNVGIGDATPLYPLTVGNGDLFGVQTDGSLIFEGSLVDSFQTVLSVVNPTADLTFQLPNATTGTYDICTSANNCTSLGAFINNTTTVQTDANIAIQSAGTGNVTQLIRARTSQAADLLQFQNSSSSVLSGFTAGGNLYFRDQTSGFTSTISVQAGSLNGSHSLTLPNAGGEICTSSGNCVGNGGSGDVFKNGQAGPLIIGTNDNTSFYLETFNQNRIQITGGGNVGIGTSGTPGQLLSVGGTTGNFTVSSAGNIVTEGTLTVNGSSIQLGNNPADGLTVFANSTFNTDVDFALADSENVTIGSTVTGTSSVDLFSLSLVNNTTSGIQRTATIENLAGSGDTEQLLYLNNADTDNTVSTGLLIQSAAGGITTAIDISDNDIITGIDLGANNIIGTTAVIDFDNFDVDGSGNVTLLGNLNAGVLTVDNTASEAGFGGLSAGTRLNVVAATGGSQVALRIDNADSTGAIAIFQDNGTPVLTIADGGDITATGTVILDGAATLTTGTDQNLTLQANGAGEIILNDLVQLPVLGTDGVAPLCINASDQIASCSSTVFGVTLQNAYDASTDPEIVVDSTRGAVTIRDNETPIAANLLEVQSNDGLTDYFAVTVGGLLTSGDISLTGATGVISTSVTDAPLTIQSNGAGTLTLDSSGTGAINVGTGANTKTITVGNSTGATQITLDAGTGGIQIGANGVANTIQIGNITGAVTQTVNIGTNATAGSTNNVNIGSTEAGTVAIQGPLTVTNRTAGSAVTLVVNNSTSTGTIAIFQDNGTPVLTIADGGDITATGNIILDGAASIASGTNQSLSLTASGTGEIVLNGSAVQISTLIGGDSSDTLLCRNVSDQLTDCGATSLDDYVTLQNAYNNVNGNTITTTDGRDITFTLTDTITDANFLVDIATGSTGRFAVQGNGTDVLSVTGSAVVIDQALTVNAAADFTSGITVSRAIPADSGTVTNVADINFTTPADTIGTNVSQGLNITPIIGNATGGTNTANIINIADVTGDDLVTLSAIRIGNLTGTTATEYAFNVGTGWDSILRVDGTEVINGDGEVITTQLSGTLFSIDSDSASPSTIAQGATVSLLGGINGIDVTHSGDTATFDLDTTEIGTTTFGAGSGFTWTFDTTSTGTDPVITFGDDTLDVTVADFLLSGDLAVNGGDITSTGALTVTPGAGTNFNIVLSTTGDFTVNTNQFVVDTSESRVGIGTAAPGATLHVLTDGATEDTLVINSGTSTGSIFVAQDNGTPVFTIADGGAITATNTLTFSGAVTDITTVTGENLTLVATGAGIIDLDDIVRVGTLGTADTNALLCRNSAGQLANCDTTGAGAAFLQGGNTFGGAAVLGTNDNFDLQFETNGTTKLTLDTSGNLTFAQASTIGTSTGALTLQPAAGSNVNINLSGTGDFAVNTDQFYVDTSESRVGIGTGTPGATLHVLTDGATEDTLVINSGTSTGNILVAQDNGNAVFTIADGGDITATGNIILDGAASIASGTNQSLSLTASGTGEIVLNGSAVQISTLIGGDSSDTLLCRNVSDQLTDCGATSLDDYVTLQNAYNNVNGNTITTTDGRDITFTLTDTITDANFLVDIATGSTGRFAVQGNGTDVLSVTGSAVVIDQALTVNAAADFTSGITVSRAIPADSGTVTNVADINFTTPADTIGTNVSQGLNITPIIGNATGGTNTANIINIADVTGDDLVTLSAIRIGNLTGTTATEYAFNVGTGWDSILRVDGTEVINGDGEVITTQLSGTLFSIDSDSASPSTIAQGATVSLLGGINGIDVTHSGDTATFDLDTTEIGTTTFGAGSGFTWTFDTTSTGTDPVITFGDDTLDVTVADFLLSGDLAVNGGDITSTGALTVTPGAGTNFNIVLSTTGDFTVNTNQFVVDTSESRVGIGTAAPGATLHVLTDGATEDTLVINSGTSTGSIFVAQDNGTPVFTIADGGAITATNTLTFSGAVTDITTVTGENLTLVATGAGIIDLDDIVRVGTLGTADTNALLCRNSAGQLANCDTTGAGAAFLQGGNTFGGAAVLGTNDNFDLQFETNGTTKLTLDTSGNLTFAQASTIGTSTGALTLQPAAGSNVNINLSGTGDFAVNTDQFYVDTSTGNVGIGTGTPTSAKLQILTGNSNGIQLTTGGATTPTSIGIGRTAIDGLLGIAGNAGDYSDAATQGDIILRSSTANLILAARSGTGAIRFTTGSSDTPKLTITNAGNVGVGIAAPDGRFHIQGTVDDEQLIVQGHSAQTSNILEVKNSGGTVLAAVTGGGVLKIGTTSNPDLASAKLLVTEAQVSTTFRVGGASDYVQNNASNQLRYFGSARNTKTVTLMPEFAGATLTGDGTNNIGTMTSDFCSGTARLSINTTICSANDEHNYYSWTAQATNDYDIYVRYQLPSDFDGWSSDNSIQMWGWRSTSNESVQLTVFNAAGTQCGTTTTINSSNTTWQLTPLGGNETSDSACNTTNMAPGSTLLVRIRLTVGSNNNFARAGAITFNYWSKF